MITRRSYMAPAIEVITSVTTQPLAVSGGRPTPSPGTNAKQRNLFDTEEDGNADESPTTFGDSSQIRNIELPTQKTIWGD